MAATAGTPRARALSAALRDARKSSGMGVRELARQLSLSHVQISNWETGARVPNVETVAMILAAIRASASERERILDLARNVTEPNWLTVGMNGIPQQLAGVVECERAARAITDWAPMLIPGLLQTTDYARAIKQSGGRLSQTDVELRVMVSASRDEIITRRSDPIEFKALIGEAALYDAIGPDEVMADQLQHLIEMSKRPNVTVQIVPQRIGWHPGLMGPFILFDFPDAPPVVYLEHHSSGAFIPTEHDVTEYHKAVEWLHEVAMDVTESSALIASTRESMEGAQ